MFAFDWLRDCDDAHWDELVEASLEDEVGTCGDICWRAQSPNGGGDGGRNEHRGDVNEARKLR